MPSLALVTGTVRRQRGDRPQLPMVNLFPETAVTEPQQFVLLSRPGLEETGVTMGAGPVRALFQKDGVLSGALFGVSGDAIYSADGTEVDAIAGDDVPSIAGNEVGVVAVAGLAGRYYNGAFWTEVQFEEEAFWAKVIEQGGRFLFIRAGTHKFYWTRPLESMLNEDAEMEVDGLDFASAENEPDRLVDALPFGDAVILGGSTTIEFWAKTGDLDAPYIPVEGRVFTKGVRATGCMAQFDNTFAWVSPDHLVYRAGNVPERISDAGIEELVAASEACRVDVFFFEGHEFLKVALDTATLLYDAQTRQWCEFASYGEDAWVAGPVAGGVFGSLIDGRLLRFSDAHADLAGPLERRFRAWLPIDGGAVRVGRLALQLNPGQTPYLSGDYDDPVAELRFSYNGGQTWDVWDEAPLGENATMGEQGEYLELTEWRALGLFSYPGALFEFRCTAPVPFDPSGASINESHGGRSRT